MSEVVQPDFQGVPLDTATIPQKHLNIDNKERSNVFPWNGQFSPQLIEVLLETFAKAGEYILDPFLGCGTVICEAGRFGNPALGAEINPAAFNMANTYSFINIKTPDRRRILENASGVVNKLTPDTACYSDRPECPYSS